MQVSRGRGELTYDIVQTQLENPYGCVFKLFQCRHLCQIPHIIFRSVFTDSEPQKKQSHSKTIWNMWRCHQVKTNLIITDVYNYFWSIENIAKQYLAPTVWKLFWLSLHKMEQQINSYHSLTVMWVSLKCSNYCQICNCYILSEGQSLQNNRRLPQHPYDATCTSYGCACGILLLVSQHWPVLIINSYKPSGHTFSSYIWLW